jgi:hypothetical protein
LKKLPEARQRIEIKREIMVEIKAQDFFGAKLYTCIQVGSRFFNIRQECPNYA